MPMLFAKLGDVQTYIFEYWMINIPPDGRRQSLCSMYTTEVCSVMLQSVSTAIVSPHINTLQQH